ncbi:BadF/BadG/BcrA/BcrD ATPase family protein [Isosphaeraceae bacterium EP7]
MTGLVIGVDGGGTSTVAWLARRDGTVLGRAQAGPSNIKAVGHDAAGQALRDAMTGAFRAAGLEIEPVEAACLGLAGADRAEDKAWLRHWAGDGPWSRNLVLVNDGDLVVAAGTPEGWGVGVIAGTGSIAVGRAADGRTSRAGGWGFVMGDEGSGYKVACAALTRIARRLDGRDPSTGPDPLAERICRALGIESPEGLVTAVYRDGGNRARIAGLAAEVVAASFEDESLILDILYPAGVDLAETVAAAARALGWHEGPLPLAMAGGFLLAAEVVRESMFARLDALGYDVRATPVPDPVRGALVLASKALEARP